MKSIFRIIVFFMIFVPLPMSAQSGFAWGVKGGLTGGQQSWSGSNSNILFRYHGAAYIESLGETSNSVIYAQAGYHVRGSAFRYLGNYVTPSGQSFRPATTTYQYRNASVGLGMKKLKPVSEKITYYYGFGLRGEYTINTNLPSVEDQLGAYFLVKEYVRPFNFGATVSGGIQMKLADLIGIVGEISIHPDFSRQYFSPPLLIYNTFTGGNEPSSERSIKNLSFEISVGFRFLRKVVYVD
jgi:hypothetical protein